jgi:putative MATE family efflux protein
MTNSAIDRSQMSLLKLTWPIWVENILRVTLSSVDVFMLSFYSEKAVAAVGLINQFVFFIQILYLMISFGASILISQHLGAKKHEEAQTFALGSITLGFIFAFVLSIATCMSAGYLLRLYNLEPVVYTYAYRFLVIYGAGSVCTALTIVLGTILRTYGHSKTPMVVNIIANVINIIGNYCALFSPFGLPVTGVSGVAASTVFSQLASCIILAVIIKRHRDIRLPFRTIFSVPWVIYRRILAIGVPSAGENLSYNVGQIVIMRIVSSLGTEAMTAMVYTITLLRYVFISSISIGSGTQIKVGYLVGAGKQYEAYRNVYGYFFSGVVLSLVMVVSVYFARTPLVHIFTQSDTIFSLVSSLLLVAMIHEPGRNFNIIIIPALKGAGDYKFPVYVGMFFMWGIGVLFAYLLGITWGLGLIGVWIALASDEWIRGLVMMFRWKNGRWRNKGLILPHTVVTSGEQA